MFCVFICVFFFQAEDGIRDAQESRGLGDVYKRQIIDIINLETNLILNDDMYLIVKKNFDSNFFS